MYVHLEVFVGRDSRKQLPNLGVWIARRMVRLMKFTWVLGADDTPVVFDAGFSGRVVVIFRSRRCRFYFIRYALGNAIVALNLLHLVRSFVNVVHRSRKLERCVAEKNRRAVRGWTTCLKNWAASVYTIFVSLLTAMASCLLQCSITVNCISSSHLCELPYYSTFVNWCLHFATRS